MNTMRQKKSMKIDLSMDQEQRIKDNKYKVKDTNHEQNSIMNHRKRINKSEVKRMHPRNGSVEVKK
jgi:hypothetical protein